jgi:copper chaperone CopZ
MAENTACGFCRESDARFFCSGCKTERYCAAGCQKAAWGRHKNVCPAKVEVLDIEGMTCQKNCGTTVQSALESVDGTEKVEVIFEDKKAHVSGTAAIEALIDAVKTVGFAAEAAVVSSAEVGRMPELEPAGVLPGDADQKDTKPTSSSTANGIGLAAPGAAHMDNPNIKCTCGCVPNIPSMFEMAALRKKFAAEKKAKAEADKQ